jgi:DNA-binding XRE family transcriptional regulator
MSGRRSWAEIKAERLAGMSPAQRREYEQRQASLQEELDAEQATYDRTLAELRRARSYTQTQLAKVLGVSQAQVSRIENQADLYLSTLASYVAALGGELELRAVFGAGQAFPIELGDLVERHEEPDEGTALTG